MAYYHLEPWGPDQDDLRAGIVASTVANVNRDPKRRRRPYEPGDFVLRRGHPEAEEQTTEDQMKILGLITAAYNRPESITTE